MALDDNTTTQLLTLLNVSAVKAGKRRQIEDQGHSTKRIKLNQRRTVIQEAPSDESMPLSPPTVEAQGLPDDKELTEPLDLEITEPVSTPFIHHFGNSTPLLSARSLVAADPEGGHARVRWKATRQKVNNKRYLVHFNLEDADGGILEEVISNEGLGGIPEKLKRSYEKSTLSLTKELRELQAKVQTSIMTYQDFHFNHLSATDALEMKATRDAVTLHLANHVLQIRKGVLRNNDRISSASASGSEAPSPETIQDQGFTRPSTLILVPFRNSAVRWLDSYLSHFPTSSNNDTQVHNYTRFVAEFSLPPGSTDKLAEENASELYPSDHIQTFRGNIDDNFRVGVKVTKKAVRLFEGFYRSDLIIASPLGLRLAIEKQKNADFLSSIEVVVLDQADVMTMQNWEHVEFIFAALNSHPKESHDTDFSRVKSWYLDGHASKLRQNIIFSSYDTPQIRSLFMNTRNVAGKYRFERKWTGAQVPEGLKQDFVKFEANNARDEVDQRFEHFTKEVFPSILKSAVQSTSTLIFVPSYFDFVRIKRWMKNQEGLSFTFLSEYSTPQDISRAREQFFKGKKSFLLVTERFHFFRRYRIRGIMNVVFYAPPDHSIFYTELLSFPFIDEGLDAGDVTCKILYSKYDAMSLERIVGSQVAASLVTE
ncbi:rRNA-binding ribosome biosynthesis protein utp25 [Tulasnella sp. 419]|nr:rRNA-binding ribosome biosynthesis protein utp25 [Tulasnella sp. 419]